MSFDGKKALVIDDEEEIREILVFYLGNEGFEVDEADSGEQGISKAEGGEYSLIITDLNMPGISGDKVIEGLKNLSIEAKIVISTGNLEIDESAVHGSLFKPFSKENVKEMLDKVFNT